MHPPGRPIRERRFSARQAGRSAGSVGPDTAAAADCHPRHAERGRTTWTLSRGFRRAKFPCPWASSSMAEQRTFNPRVVGSSPTGPTNRLTVDVFTSSPESCRCRSGHHGVTFDSGARRGGRGCSVPAPGGSAPVVVVTPAGGRATAAASLDVRTAAAMPGDRVLQALGSELGSTVVRLGSPPGPTLRLGRPRRGARRGSGVDLRPRHCKRISGKASRSVAPGPRAAAG